MSSSVREGSSSIVAGSMRVNPSMQGATCQSRMVSKSGNLHCCEIGDRRPPECAFSLGVDTKSVPAALSHLNIPVCNPSASGGCRVAANGNERPGRAGPAQTAVVHISALDENLRHNRFKDSPDD